MLILGNLSGFSFYQSFELYVFYLWFSFAMLGVGLQALSTLS
jgi:hypothetical protein